MKSQLTDAKRMAIWFAASEFSSRDIWQCLETFMLWGILLASGGHRLGVLLTSYKAYDGPTTKSHLAYESLKVENSGVGQVASV